MKSRVSEDRFLIPGLWALSSFSFALLGEKKKKSKIKPCSSRKKTMFTKCVSKAATSVCHHLWVHTAQCLLRSPSEMSHSRFNHTQPCYSVNRSGLMVDIPLHCWLCPGRDGLLFFPFDFKLFSDGEVTKEYPALVHQMALVLSYSHGVQECLSVDSLQHNARNGHLDLPRSHSSSYHWPPP